MNRKLLFLSALILVLVSASLFWAKWKQDNPTPTPQDLALRQRLLETKLASIQWRSRFYYIVSAEDVKEIAAHFAVVKSSQPIGLLSPDRYEIHFHSPGHFYDVIIMDEGDNQYFYIANMGHADADEPKQLHPATVRYLRHWLGQSRIQKHFAKV